MERSQRLLARLRKKKMTENSNASAAADFMKELHEKAEKLREVSAWLREREEMFKQETDAKFAEQDLLRSELLSALKTLGLSSVKVASGDSFIISKRKSFQFENEIALIKWATQHKLVTPDKMLVKQKLTKLLGTPEFPEFAKVVEQESITVRKAAGKEDKEEKDVV